MGWQRPLLVLGVFALIPGLAATGLSLPLPAAVERIAAALVPWAEAATFSDQPVARGAAGSIVLTSTERKSSGEAAPLETASASPRAQSQNRRKMSNARGTANEPPANAPVRTAPMAADVSGPADRVDAKPEQNGAGPALSPPVHASSEQPRSGTPEPRPASGTQPKTDPGTQPQPGTDPGPVPTQPSVVPAPVQQTVTTVAETTQTIVDNTVPALSETVQPVTAIVSNPGGVVGGILGGLDDDHSGSNSGSGSGSNSGSGSGSNSGSGSGSDDDDRSGSNSGKG